MKQLDLSPRLAALAALVPAGARLADVGTDHAYLPVWLLLRGKIRGAIASDVNQGPLDRGRETARLYGVAEKIDFRRCDGLAGLTAGEADTVVLAGMGGDLMARILAQAPWTREVTLLLQPMSSQEDLRQWLAENGYAITGEQVVREGEKFYQLLTATGGSCSPYTPGERLAGRQRQGEEAPHRLAFLEDLIRRRQRALAGMAKSASPDAGALARERAVLADLQRLREEWITWQP